MTRLQRLAAWLGWRNIPRLADPAPLPGEPQPPDDLDALIEATRETYGPDFGRWEDSLKPYRHAYIATCPFCFGDLQDEGFAWYCPACQESVSFNQIVLYDESGLNDD